MVMMEYFLLPFLVGLLISTAFAITVRLHGPKYTRRNDIVTFNCSTDTPSVGLEAEILVNSKTYTNMRTHNNICFSAVQGLKCAKDVCQCSKTGYWFLHKYNVKLDNVENDVLKVTCVMKFGSEGVDKMFDSIIIEIIDFSGPTLNVGAPLVAGTTARVTCQVLTKLKHVNLSWNCVKNGHVNKTKTFNKYLSTLTFIVKPFHQNTNCTCTGSYIEFHISSSVQLDVNNKPILNSTRVANCNMSSSVQLFCTLTSEVSSFGFNSWTHLFDGIAVRVLPGVIYGNMSMLNISHCSYQDAGIYICSAWNKFYDKEYYSNSSTRLTFNGPPIILSTRIVTENGVTITVNFYSTSDVQRPVWFSMSEPIYDKTGVNVTIDNMTLKLPVHNRAITCQGYVAKMSMGIFRNMKYTVLLKNEFGDTRKTFELHSDLIVSFDFRFWIFGLAIFGVFLVATTMTVVVLRGRQFQGVVHIVGPLERSPTIPIYHSAPASLDDDHVYERTNPQYLELLEIPQERHYSDIKEEEDELQLSRSDDGEDYEEID